VCVCVCVCAYASRRVCLGPRHTLKASKGRGRYSHGIGVFEVVYWSWCFGVGLRIFCTIPFKCKGARAVRRAVSYA